VTCVFCAFCFDPRGLDVRAQLGDEERHAMRHQAADEMDITRCRSSARHPLRLAFGAHVRRRLSPISTRSCPSRSSAASQDARYALVADLEAFSPAPRPQWPSVTGPEPSGVFQRPCSPRTTPAASPQQIARQTGPVHDRLVPPAPDLVIAQY